MECSCGNDFTMIADETIRVDWCSNCGSIRVKHVTEEDYSDIKSPHIAPKKKLKEVQG